jgi:hypothetical protein
MAIKIPIITELQDEGIKRAKREFDKFKGAVLGAEGTMGKFKAGGKAAFEAVAANATAFALAGAAGAIPEQGTPEFDVFLQALQRNGFNLNPDTAWRVAHQAEVHRIGARRRSRAARQVHPIRDRHRR